MSTYKIYTAVPEGASYQHIGRVFVHDGMEAISESHPRTELSARLDLVNHSPTGFGWNYQGSGAAQLALAILADATGDDELAVRMHQPFKTEIISGMPRGEWELNTDFIREWIEANTQEETDGTGD